MKDVENPMLSPKTTDDLILKPIGKCHYRYCEEKIHRGEGFEFDGYIYCSTSCIGEEGIEDGSVIDLAQQ